VDQEAMTKTAKQTANNSGGSNETEMKG